MSLSNTLEADLISPGSVLREKWEITKRLDDREFGQMYEGFDLITQEKVSLKLESPRMKKKLAKIDVAVLKRLQDVDYYPKLLGCGRNDRFSYVVTSIRGDNLRDLRYLMPRTRFSLSTTVRLACQMLDAIEAVHNVGFLHRDVKPFNLSLGALPINSRKIFLSEFSLARQYTNANGEVRSARPIAGFRGTVRYASINAHLNKEMGRHDDLWSMFYTLMEFMNGQLPWRRVKDRDLVGQMKQKCDYVQLVKFLPTEFRHFLNHLQTLDYYKKPDYNYLRGLFQQLIKRRNIQLDDPYDWEEIKVSRFSQPAESSKSIENQVVEDVPLGGVGGVDDIVSEMVLSPNSFPDPLGDVPSISSDGRTSD